MLYEEAFLNYQSSILSLLFKLFKLSLKQKRDLPYALSKCDWEINEYKQQVEDMRVQYESTHSSEFVNRAKELYDNMVDKCSKREIYLRDEIPLTGFINMIWSHMETIIHCSLIEEVVTIRMRSCVDLPQHGLCHYL